MNLETVRKQAVNTVRYRMFARESDHFIVPEKPVKADGGKGMAVNRLDKLKLIQTGAGTYQ